MRAVEIICRNCGADTLIQREAVYEGLSVIGEKLSCAACGHVYASEEEVPFKQKKNEPVVFTDADRPEGVEVFEDGENSRLCRYCAHYIVNPFTQFCSIHRKEVQATDSCPQFREAEQKDDAGGL